MKPYIDFCVGQRQAAASSFEQDLFKLLMNFVFGKTMENVRRRTQVRVFTSGHQGGVLRRCLSSPIMRGVTVISPNMVTDQFSLRSHDGQIWAGQLCWQAWFAMQW